jgi:hypothetical protein
LVVGQLADQAKAFFLKQAKAFLHFLIISQSADERPHTLGKAAPND